MGLILNPTGGTVRNDRTGSGYFHAPRDGYLHKGVDYTLPHGVGQYVLAPISGRAVRVAYPYSDSKEYSGIVIEGIDIGIKMFYVSVRDRIIGENVVVGQVIGIAQDVTKHYKTKHDDDQPHVHLEVEWINPLIIS